MIWAFIASIATSSVVSISIPIGLVFDIPVSVIVFIGTFAVSFMLFTRHTINYMRTLSDGLTVISAGNLHHRIPTVRKDELGKVAEHINAMAEKLESLMEKERDAGEIENGADYRRVLHDLRTPLTSIIGYLELLKEKGYRDEAEFERFIGNTHNKARQLKTLIDELFEYTRLSHSGAKLELETIDLKQMLIQMVAEIQPLAEEERISLNLELPDRPLFMRMDPEQMRRAIDNLLMNALEYVEPGVMKVSLSISDQSVTITVENDGRSISKEQETLLFDRFYKIDGSRSIDSLKTGAGLGLSITRGIAELHGGKAYLIHDDGHFKFR